MPVNKDYQAQRVRAVGMVESIYVAAPPCFTRDTLWLETDETRTDV